MPLAAKGLIPGRDIFVAFSPERINPGVDAFSHEDVPRVVGGVTPACGEAAAALLSASTKLVHVVPSADVAEMTKLVENTFRAVNIALANEFADICHELGMEVMDVIDAASTKPYGFMPFTPGPGVGGHCIPCDPHYLLWQLRKARVTAPVIETPWQASQAGRTRWWRRPAGFSRTATMASPVPGFSSLVWPTSRTSKTCGNRRPWKSSRS